MIAARLHLADWGDGFLARTPDVLRGSPLALPHMLRSRDGRPPLIPVRSGDRAGALVMSFNVGLPRLGRLTRCRFLLDRICKVARPRRRQFHFERGKATADPSGHCMAAATGIAASGEPSARITLAVGLGL